MDDTWITNFSPNQIEIFEKAIELHGTNDVYIKNNALWCGSETSLNRFWAIYDLVYSDMNVAGGPFMVRANAKWYTFNTWKEASLYGVMPALKKNQEVVIQRVH